MSEEKIAEDAARAIAEAVVIIPMGAVNLALNGWWGVLTFCVGWALFGLGKGAFQFWRLKREYT